VGKSEIASPPVCGIIQNSPVRGGDPSRPVTTDSFSPSKPGHLSFHHLYKIENRKRLSFFTSACFFFLCIVAKATVCVKNMFSGPFSFWWNE
jgi:hypothetical protein